MSTYINQWTLSARQHVGLDEYKANLQCIYQHAARIADVVVLVTPTPIDDDARLKLLKESQPTATAPERTNARTCTYAHACKDVAAELHAHCFDAHELFTRKEDWKTLLSDGLHFNARGNEVFFDGLLKYLANEGVIDVDNMPLDAPLNADIDEKEWERSLKEWYDEKVDVTP